MKVKILILTLSMLSFSIITNAQVEIISGGTGTNYTLAIPGTFVLTNGLKVTFKANVVSNAGATMNVSGSGAKPIVKEGGGTNIAGGDIKAGQIVTLAYDGTSWQMLSALGTAITAPTTYWSPNGSDIFNNNAGNVGIGTNLPEATLHVKLPNGAATQVFKFGHGNQPSLEWYFNVDALANFSIMNEGNGTAFSAMTFDPSNGYVGIGTTPSLSILDVNGQITMRQGAIANYIPVADANGTMTWKDPTTITTADDGDWSGAGTGSMYATNTTDNVGIGTITPSEKLDVTGSIQSSLGYKLSGIAGTSVLYNSGSVLVLNNLTSKEIRLTQAGVSRLTVAASGNVGIGTINPTGMLDVTTSTLNRGSQIQNSFTSASDKDGVYANASGGGAGSNIGGWFESFGSPTGISYGVAGQALATGSENRGVYGSASNGTTNWAGYFDLGDVNINNTAYIGGNLLVGGVPSIQAKAQINGTGYFWAFKVLGSTSSQVLGVESAGKVIIGNTTSSPASTLDVEGSAAIGATYSGTTAAPTNGLIVEGNTGIGTSSPNARLEVVGTTNTNSTTDGYLNVGPNTGTHLTMDNNELQARTSASTTTLYLNYWGGNILMASSGSGANVGIGTNFPTYKLQVSTNSAAKPTSNAWTVASDA